MIEEEAELAAKFANEEHKRKADQRKRELEESVSLPGRASVLPASADASTAQA